MQSSNVEKDRRTVRKILHLRPDKDELTLTFGMVSRSDTEIALLTRSMSEIFLELAATIEAPAAHLQDGRALWTHVAQPLHLLARFCGIDGS